MLDHLHVLEKKNYKQSIEVFFDSYYGCLVLDDKMIGSKAMDVGKKMLVTEKQPGTPLVTVFVILFSSLF
jgi:hypothetical protein